jgi:hypothetical protein
MSRDLNGAWSVRRLWQGDAPIRWLEASPSGRFLLVIDANNRAQQFNLSQGSVGAMDLQLPSPVEDAVFSPDGSRVLFRTARWIHRARSSTAGLMGLDSMLVPRPLAGARIVFGDPANTHNSFGGVFYLPMYRDGVVQLGELRFDSAPGGGLFGNRENLIADWTTRLSIGEESSAD